MDNYNYPMGADNSNAPWNQVDPPKREFQVLISQTLSKSVEVTTSDYTGGELVKEYERDDEGGWVTVGGYEDADTSDTDWKAAYSEQHYTPLELIAEFKKMLENQKNAYSTDSYHKKILHLIDECSNWVEDDCEIMED